MCTKAGIARRPASPHAEVDVVSSGVFAGFGALPARVHVSNVGYSPQGAGDKTRYRIPPWLTTFHAGRTSLLGRSEGFATSEIFLGRWPLSLFLSLFPSLLLARVYPSLRPKEGAGTSFSFGTSVGILAVGERFRPETICESIPKSVDEFALYFAIARLAFRVASALSIRKNATLRAHLRAALHMYKHYVARVNRAIYIYI